MGRRAIKGGGWPLAVLAALMSAGAAWSQPGIELVDATETVAVEHADRRMRLQRAARNLGVQPRPQFLDTVVDASLMPPDFRVDTPVLRVVFDERSFFDTGSDVLLPEAERLLEVIAVSLRGEPPDVAVFVAGHTDSRGSEASNHDLSVRRAATVATAMAGMDVGAVTLWRVGFGEAVPLRPNDTPENMAVNRRVEFLFAARTEPVLDVLKRQLDTVCVARTRADSERCRSSIELRDSFEAVEVNPGRVRVPLAPSPGARLPGRHQPAAVAGRAARETVKGGAGRDRVEPERPMQVVTLAPRRARIDIVRRYSSIAMPSR